MNPKAIIQKIVSWFKGEATTIETRIVVDAKAAENAIADCVSQLRAAIAVELGDRRDAGVSLDSTVKGASWTISKSGEFTINDSTTEVSMNNVNVAIQIALALKAIDAALSADAVQAATNAALAAAYPAPDAAAAAQPAA
ncbi:hypothetical protein [Paraburkholderia sp. EG304]|uniref:hypothetical protein n=1 Tax=Paraburkholderia sp. EG304 TaxID=3237015 RepID=UPI00397D16D2